MKKLKNTEALYDKKIKIIDNFLLNFKYKNDLKNEIILILDNIKTCTLLIKFLSEKFKLKAYGKQTTNFWTQRGYSFEEAKDLIKPFKIKRDKTTSPMNIDFWIKKGFSETDAVFNIKSQRKINKEYWLKKGFSEDESINKVKEIQSISANLYHIKKKLNPEKYKYSNSLTLDYYLNKGFNKDESIKKLKDRQTTFSKEICIEKYGQDSGLEIWKNRQIKWQDNLNNISKYNGTDGKTITMNYKITNYDLIKLINSISFKNKKEILDIIISSDNIESVIDKYVNILKNENEITFFKAVRPILNSTFFKLYYNVSREYIYSLILPKLSFIKCKYGNIRWYNNHICRSDNEYIIAHYLTNNNINYKYEKYYNLKINKMRCDFYLIDYDYYIEYNGMHETKYENKINFLKKENINNVILSKNVDEIILFINKLKKDYENKN